MTKKTKEIEPLKLDFAMIAQIYFQNMMKDLTSEVENFDVHQYISDLYEGKITVEELDNKLFKTDKHKFNISTFYFTVELYASYDRLSTTIKLFNTIRNKGRSEKLKLINYYLNYYHIEYCIFIDRVWNYINTVKSKMTNKQDKQQLTDLREKYNELFKEYIEIRNKHTHRKSYIDEGFRKLGLINMHEELNIGAKNLPQWDKCYKEFKKYYTNKMIKDLEPLRKNTNEYLNILNSEYLYKII